jgi:DNA-binding response OmpR family regulator
MHALLVDDEPSIRLALRRFFTREGWGVAEATDGRAALDILLAPAPGAPTVDLIVCDLRMPGLSGVDLHEALRTSRPELLSRLVLATGDMTSPDVAEFVRRTTCPILQKPFELAQLRALMRSAQDPGKL